MKPRMKRTEREMKTYLRVNINCEEKVDEVKTEEDREKLRGTFEKTTEEALFEVSGIFSYLSFGTLFLIIF